MQMQVWFPFRYFIVPLLACITSTKASKCKYVQKPWFLQRSMPSCKFSHNSHRHAKHYVRLPCFIFKTNQHYSFILLKILLKIDSERYTMSKPKKNLQGSSKTPPRRPQDASRTPSRRPHDASKPPPSRIKIVRQSTRGLKPPPSSAKDSPRRLQNAKTRVQDGPRRHQSASKTA